MRRGPERGPFSDARRGYLRRRLIKRTPPDAMSARPASARFDSSAVLVDGRFWTPRTAPFVCTPFTADGIVAVPFAGVLLDWKPSTPLFDVAVAPVGVGAVGPAPR